MRFVLIRHGQSGNNAVYDDSGSEAAGRDPDTKLTQLGHDQARRLADAVGSGVLPWRVTHLYSSLMARAIQTAAPLAEVLDLEVRSHPELFECGGPYHLDPQTGEHLAHPGSPRSELAALTPRLVLDGVAQDWGWWAGPFESDEEAFRARAARVIAHLRQTHADEDVVALVSHGWFHQYLLRELLGVPQMSGWFAIDNTAISLLFDETGQWAGKATAARINWTPHLGGSAR